MASEQPLNPEPSNSCCDEWKRKCSKLLESRNALRQAVKLLEQRINQIEAQNVNLNKAYQEEQARTKIEKEEKLKEANARVSLENDISTLKSEVTLLWQKCGSYAQEENVDVKVLQPSLSDREMEINRLKELLGQEKKRADSERMIAEKEKKKADRAKRIADAELVKVEEQKKLAEDNWKRAMEAKCVADQMSQKLVEDKQTIEDLKQKLHEISSLRKPTEISGVSPDINVNAESNKVKHLEHCPKLEKLRTKNARKKFKLEASHRSILGCLKLNFIKLFCRLDMLDKSFSSSTESINSITKDIPNMQKSNVMSQVNNLDMSQMHSRIENELKKPCSTRMNGCDPLRKNMWQGSLDLSGGNYTESITGINSNLEPLERDSNRTKLQCSAVNSSTASFSDGQLVGSQERDALQVTASTKSALQSFNARTSMSNPSNRLVIDHDRKSKSILDTVECIANLSSEGKKLYMQVDDKLSDLCGLLYGEVNKSTEGGREGVSNCKDNLQAKSDRVCKKRKKHHRDKTDIYEDVKKGTKDIEVGIYEDANDCGHTLCPVPHTPGTTQACRDRIFEAANGFNSLISFDEVDYGNVMKLLTLENAIDEECYRRAMDVSLSPSLPEIATFDRDNVKPFLEEALLEDFLSQRELFMSTRCDVIDVEINSNEQKFCGLTVPSNAHHSHIQTRNTNVKLPHVHAQENIGDTFLSEGIAGSLQSQFNFCCVFSNIEDNSISRIFGATENCIARCSLETQTDWAVASILTAVEMEETLLQKEKYFVLLSLLLHNFTMITAMKFGKPWDGKNLIHCLNSYAEHIRRVMTDAGTRILFLQRFSLHELLCIIEGYLIEGKVIFKNKVPSATLSEIDLRTNNFLVGVDTFSSDVASSEQLVAGSIILASICVAMDHVGFICEASYNILRFCRWDSLTVLCILHIFAHMGEGKFFKLGNLGMLTVLKSLVKFLEDESMSVTTTSCLPSINQLHTELCTSNKCPFSEGAESVDIVTLLLLENINNCLLQRAGQLDSSNFRFFSDNRDAGQMYNQEMVHCSISMDCGVPCCLKKHEICATQPNVIINVTICQLSDVLSLLELIANKMSWQWTNNKLVPQLLNMLDSCVVENFAIAIIVLLGQLGRLGVDVGGYEDRGVENIRYSLFSYLYCYSSIKACPSVQIAAATALFGLLPLDFGSLFQTKSNLPPHSGKSVSDDAENLRKWFSGLGKDQQDLLHGILRCTDINFYQ